MRCRCRRSARDGQPIVAGFRAPGRPRTLRVGPHVSFRNRLTFFFILLVILPVLAVALVGILIVRDSEQGKTDAGLEQAQTAAEGLYRESRDRSERVAKTVEMDRELAVAVRDGDRAAVKERLEDLARRGGAQRVRL